MARRPTASSVYSTTTWKVSASTVACVRLKVTGQPAWACSAKAADFQHMADGQQVVHALRLQTADGRKTGPHPRLKMRDLG